MQGTLSMVVAMTPTRVIGNNMSLPWRNIPSDMRRFRNITKAAGAVIMGRKTFQSIIDRNHEALRERQNIVLTREGSFYVAHYDGVPVHSVEEALHVCGGTAAVIGGEEIYRLFLPLAQTLYITTVYTDTKGTAHFPDLVGDEWRMSVPSGRARQDPKDPYDTSLTLCKRK